MLVCTAVIVMQAFIAATDVSAFTAGIVVQAFTDTGASGATGGPELTHTRATADTGGLASVCIVIVAAGEIVYPPVTPSKVA